jgi:hypothetical protein
MPDHWHMVLRPSEDGLMGRVLRWGTATHPQRYHAHYHTVGEGHLYQSCFKSFPVADHDHFLVVCRYVERNALRANLVQRAEDWRYGSLWRWTQTVEPLPKLLSPLADTSNAEVDRTCEPTAQRARTASIARVPRARATFWRVALDGRSRPADRLGLYAPSPRSSEKGAGIPFCLPFACP